jgi:signal transduction histidine kinase
MGSISQELLLLARVRKADVVTEPLDMASIVKRARQRLEAMVEKVQAQVVVPATWPTALGYGPWVEEVWVNYLSNAFKYGGEPPHVELGATMQADGMARFWIRDNGPGLSLEDQERLFTPFTRLDPFKSSGHGLGLSIARRIIERLGGHVGVESDGVPGRGSVFSFTLPVAEETN